MALIVFVWLLTMSALMFQGLYTLCTGKTDLFLLRPARPQRLVKRLGYSLFIYLLPGVLMASILANTVIKVGPVRVEKWIIGNLGMMIGLMGFFTVGLVLITQPRMMLRWMIHDHPELSDTKGVLSFTRWIGAFFCVVVLVVLSRL